MFRGLTVAAMILVNNAGDYGAGYAMLRHASWNGCTPTDWIFPFFLFLVGISAALSTDRRRSKGDSDGTILTHALRRALVLFGMGMVLNLLPFLDVDWETFRIPGTLQRIGICYFLGTLVYMKTSTRSQAAISAAILLGYWAAMTFLRAPDSGASDYRPAASFGAWVDRLLLGKHLAYGNHTYDVNGFFGSIPGIVNVLLGMMAARLVRSPRTQGQKALRMACAGLSLAALGWIWGGCPKFESFLALGGPSFDAAWVSPINKPIWSSSYVLYTCGLALVGMALCVWSIDIRGFKRWAAPSLVFGTNAILAYVLADFLQRMISRIKVGAETVQSVCYKNLALPLASPANASLIYAFFFTTLILAVTAIFYRRRIFFKA